MENIVIRKVIAVIIFVIILSGCQTEYPRDLVEIDLVADGDNPKQAIDLLDGLRTTARNYSDRDKYYYELLKIKANDKAYIKHTSDSMIIEIIDYYEGIGDKNLLPMAYYYGGRVYRDLGDAPQALEYFQKCMDNPLLSAELRSVLFLQIGDLYMKQNAYDLAIDTHNKSYEYCREVGDSSGMVYALVELGHIYKCIEKYDSAKVVYENAFELSKQIGNDERLIPMLHTQLTLLHLLNNDIEKARISYEYCREHHSPVDSNLMDVISQRYYVKIGNNDSIRFYSYKLLINQDVLDNELAYRQLMLLSRKDHDIDAAISYMDSFLCYKDSVVQIEDAQNVRNLNATYNYYSKERENRRLEDEGRRWQMGAIVGGFSAVILSALVIILILNNRRKKAELELTRQKIKEVETLMAEREAQQQHRHEELSEAMARLRSSEIYRELIDIQRGVSMRKTFRDSDWVAVSKAVNEAYPLFDVTLNKFQYKLSKKEYRMSLMLKMQFSNTFIAKMCCMAENSVTSMRTRLYKKVFLREGDSMAWDTFITSL